MSGQVPGQVDLGTKDAKHDGGVDMLREVKHISMPAAILRRLRRRGVPSTKPDGLTVRVQVMRLPPLERRKRPRGIQERRQAAVSGGANRTDHRGGEYLGKPLAEPRAARAALA